MLSKSSLGAESTSNRLQQIPYVEDRDEEIGRIKCLVKSLERRLEKNEYRSIKQRREDEKMLANNISYLKQIRDIKHSLEFYKKRLEQDNNKTTEFREVDMKKLARNAADLSVMMLCSQAQTRAEHILKGKDSYKKVDHGPKKDVRFQRPI